MRVSSRQKQDKHDMLMSTYTKYRTKFNIDEDIEKMILRYSRYTCEQFEKN